MTTHPLERPVCAWPEYRGRGLGRRLINSRGQVPFVHSYAGNAKAIGLYEESLGFPGRSPMLVTVLERV